MIIRPLAVAIGLACSLAQPLCAAQRPDDVIIVTASHMPISLAQSGSAATVISAGQIRNRAPQMVSDLLRDVPGFAVSRNGVLGSATQLRVRGAEGNHVLVLIDGVEANDPAQGDEFNWGTLSAADIERIEIVRGPQTALLGSDAVAAVVNIITREAAEGFSADAHAEGGSFGTRQAGFGAGYRDEAFDLQLGVSDLDTDGENIARSGGEDDGYSNRSYNLKGGWSATEALRLGLAARRSDGRSSFDDIDYATGLPADAPLWSDFRTDTARLQADYASFGGAWQHKLVYALTDSHNDNFTDGLSAGRNSAQKDQYRYISSLNWAAGTQRVSLLLEREEEDFRQRGEAMPWGDPNQDRERSADSAGLEYRGTYADALTLAASVRHDDNSEFEDADTWRLEAVYAFDAGTRLRAAGGAAVKNPTFAERFGYYTDFRGNPDLQPEESRSWEVGVDRSWAGERFSAGLTLFHADLEDEIDGFVWDPVYFVYTAGNLDGSSEREGLEFEFRAALTDALALSGSYTYTDSQQPDPLSGKDQDELRRAPHIGSLTLAWQARDDLQLNLNAQYNGRQDDQFFPPWPESARIVALDDYTLVTFNATWTLSRALEVYGRVENLLDEDYEEVYGFATPGIGGYLGLRYRLAR